MIVSRWTTLLALLITAPLLRALPYVVAPPPNNCCTVTLNIPHGTETKKWEIYVNASDPTASTQSAIQDLFNNNKNHPSFAGGFPQDTLLQVYRQLEQMRSISAPHHKSFLFVNNNGQGTHLKQFMQKGLGMREVKDLEVHNISIVWISWPRQVRWEYVTPGVTLVNTIQGIAHLDRKDYLQRAMERKSAMCSLSQSLHVQHRCLVLSTFFPKTFSIDTRKGCISWWKAVNEDFSSAWLIKPPDKFAGELSILHSSFHSSFRGSYTLSLSLFLFTIRVLFRFALLRRFWI